MNDTVPVWLSNEPYPHGADAMDEREPDGVVELRGRCATCRWWAHNPGFTEDDRMPDGWKPCLLTEAGARDYKHATPDHPETKAYAFGLGTDYGDSYAYLATAPDFGCVQWEPKE